jgi:hypothetical protein
MKKEGYEQTLRRPVNALSSSGQPQADRHKVIFILSAGPRSESALDMRSMLSSRNVRRRVDSA